MNDSSSQPRSKAAARRFMATVWPAASEADSESQRRKKFALRSGQLAVVAVVSGISMGVLVCVGWWQHGWHGWNPLPESLLEFFYAVLFTLAVSSERARGEVERLAGELSAANGKLREYAAQAEELAAT